MAGRILLTGATGVLGQALLPLLMASGDQVRAVSRQPRQGDGGAEWVLADLRAPGLGQIVADVDVVVHCATAPRGDEAATRNLLAALTTASPVPRMVYISVAGIDQIPLGYYRAKLAAERLVARSGLPWTILRATQFHELFVRVFGAQRRLPALIVPSATRFQPVAAAEVAQRLASLVASEPGGRVPDFGGPEILDAAALGYSYLQSAGRRSAVLPVRIPGKVGAALRRGANLAPAHPDGRITFAEFLAGVSPP